jgi:hypothetical protein
MPRTRYTKLIREQQQAQFARQETELRALARELRRDTAMLLPPLEVVRLSEERKSQRRLRREQKQLLKPARKDAA